MKYLKLIIFLFFFLSLSFIKGQKQANIWYFGKYAGVDFNGGIPIAIPGPFVTSRACSAISDSLGNFLMANDGEFIFNKLKAHMLNGDDIKCHEGAFQGSVFIQKPGSDNLYYFFSNGDLRGLHPWSGLYYSVIDMNLDNGKGAVTEEKNILLSDAWDAIDKIVAVKHENGKDIWVITWKYYEPGYAAFLVTENGVNTNAVFSPGEQKSPQAHVAGNMKISHDKKHLVAAFEGFVYEIAKPDIEICNFNAQTGEVDLLYVLRLSYENGLFKQPSGAEFSPDSKYLYLSFHNPANPAEEDRELFQFDMTFYNDSLQFYENRILLKKGARSLGMQLATDGKIYLTTNFLETTYDYLSVINRPWEKGTACQYQTDAVYLDFDGQGRQVWESLPNILVDYLFRFEWKGRCSSEPFVFKNNFQPEPSYIRWSFSDPDAGADSISYELNPTHYFTHDGEFEVKVTVNYPNGRLEKTSRVVTVDPSPNPDLGSDTLKCEFDEITLNAGNEDGVYVWSTGEFGINKNEITISDTGWYSVQVTNDISCPGYDSIYVGLFPAAEFIEDNLNIIPTSCAGTSGQILGLQVVGAEPITYEWQDAGGNIVGNDIDITGLGVGDYYLHIFDNNNCETISTAYTITDAGDVVVSDVLSSNTHCSQNIASIDITAEPNPTDLLYSIDNGNSWQTGDGFFDNLPSGNYFVRAKDASGCEGIYDNNPVIINDIPGPVVNSVTVTDEIDNLANASIDISATVSSGDIYYSIDNGSNYQTNNGLFQNLSANTYLCIVKDDFGCDTTFEIQITNIYSQIIEALAGNGNTCIGDAAVVPLKVSDFTDIYKFNLKLTYDTSLLVCSSYINANTDLESGLTVSILPNTDEININWQGDSEISLDDNSVLLELVFSAKAEGMSGIDWAAQQGESAFFNSNLEEINANYIFGSLRIYTRPQIIMPPQLEACAGDTLMVFPFVDGGSGEANYLWQYPDGSDYPYQMLLMENVELNNSGTYTLTVTDTIDCVEQQQIQITINPWPQPDFAGTDTIYAEQGFVLNAGEGFESYYWNTGDTTSSINIYDEGIYIVDLTSFPGCKSSTEVTVLWGGIPFVLPNAFSPNGDGLNDVFIPIRKYDLVKQYQMLIFNRWGQQIFESQNIDSGWDGTYQGKPSPQGTYIYKIIYTAYPNYDESRIETGQVVLVK